MKRTKVIVTVAFLGVGVLSGCEARPDADLVCDSRPAEVLAAQSVSTAAYVPCIDNVMSPWTLLSTDTDQERTEVYLEWSGAQSGEESARVTLQPACSVEGATATSAEAPEDVEVSESTANNVVSTYYSFDGGCVVVEVTRAPGGPVEAPNSEEFTVELIPRESLNDYVLEQTEGEVSLDPDSAP